MSERIERLAGRAIRRAWCTWCKRTMKPTGINDKHEYQVVCRKCGRTKYVGRKDGVIG